MKQSKQPPRRVIAPLAKASLPAISGGEPQPEPWRHIKQLPADAQP
jgi:hypothetical protein